jgi:hypothetical protein
MLLLTLNSIGITGIYKKEGFIFPPLSEVFHPINNKALLSLRAQEQARRACQSQQLYLSASR